MRKGQNPAKFVKDVARPERITAALLNYIPFLSGFYAETLDVLRVSLDSMRREAGLPFDLMVFDNGVGFPAGFDPLTAKTLGLKLVTFLAKHQMQARIALSTEKGTEFTFSFGGQNEREV